MSVMPISGFFLYRQAMNISGDNLSQIYILSILNPIQILYECYMNPIFIALI